MKLKDDKVTVICYGKEEIWDSRYEAIEFYTDAMYGSDGSERDRYVNILGDLECGFDTAYDSDSDIPKEEMDRRFALYDKWAEDGLI